jgi:hypothetical protein
VTNAREFVHGESGDVRQEARTPLAVPREPVVRAGGGVAGGEVLARPTRRLDARRDVEHRQILSPVLVQVATFHDLGAQRRVDRDAIHGIEVERPQEVAGGISAK